VRQRNGSAGFEDGQKDNSEKGGRERLRGVSFTLWEGNQDECIAREQDDRGGENTAKKAEQKKKTRSGKKYFGYGKESCPGKSMTLRRCKRVGKSRKDLVGKGSKK